MLIDLAKLRADMRERLNHADHGRGFEQTVHQYENSDLDDPDTVLSLARAEGVDLAAYQASEPGADTFNTRYDTDQDLDDLDNAVDDLSGSYY